MKLAKIFRVAAASAAALAMSCAAHAQLFRAYLSSTGSDANNCTLQAPCRLLPAALAAVADGGQIWMLNSANYNTSTVLISKSVNILAIPGEVGSVVSTDGPAIQIPAGSPVVVSLRNLSIGPLSGTSFGNGIENRAQGSKLTIDRCTLANLPSAFLGTSGAAATILDTTFRDNTTAVALESGATADIVGSTFLVGGGIGLDVESGPNPSLTAATVTDSTIAGAGPGSNAVGAFVIASAAGTISTVSFTRSTLRGLAAPFDVGAGNTGRAEVVIGHDIVTHNGDNWVLAGTGAAIFSLGNNQITDFQTDTGASLIQVGDL